MAGLWVGLKTAVLGYMVAVGGGTPQAGLPTALHGGLDIQGVTNHGVAVDYCVKTELDQKAPLVLGRPCPRHLGKTVKTTSESFYSPTQSERMHTHYEDGENIYDDRAQKKAEEPGRFRGNKQPISEESLTKKIKESIAKFTEEHHRNELAKARRAAMGPVKTKAMMVAMMPDKPSTVSSQEAINNARRAAMGPQRAEIIRAAMAPKSTSKPKPSSTPKTTSTPKPSSAPKPISKARPDIFFDVDYVGARRVGGWSLLRTYL